MRISGATIRLSVAGLILVLLVATAPGAARAEWFGDIYVGWSLTDDADVRLEALGMRATARDAEFDKTYVVGARVGHWFESLPWLGLAVDGSFFSPDIGPQRASVSATIPGLNLTPPGRLRRLDLDIVPVSLDLMLRLPLLTGADFPHGRLQPYVAAGPAAVYATMEARDLTTHESSDSSESDFSFGVKAAAGLAFLITKDIGLFAEYRLTHASPEFSFQDVDVGRVKVKTDVDTMHFLFGLTARF